MKKYTVYLVDDHQLLIDGVSKIISEIDNLEVIGSSNDGASGFTQIKRLQPDLALLDLDLPEINGLDLASQLLAEQPALKIAILTMHNESGFANEMLKRGVHGYFLKNMDRDDFIYGIKSILQGKTFYSSGITESLVGVNKKPLKRIQNPDLLASLSDREKEILGLIANGYTHKEIGEQLFISPRTVDSHRTKILEKLQLDNLAALIKFALQNGLAD